MPTSITAMPDAPTPADTTVPAPGWTDTAWSKIIEFGHTNWALYTLTGLLALLLLLSLRSRRKRTRAEAAGNKGDLTRADRAVTRITGILATAVVATGAWKVFGLPALHLHPAFRVILFAFAEAQIIAAWRRVRRHIHRHATLGRGTRTIYGIALGSAVVAAFDASVTVEVLLRFFAAFVAAYMIAEELAEELDIHLTAHPHLRTGNLRRQRGRIKWAVNLERVLVWLRLAEPTERTVEEVERQRRIARFARTSYRLHLLKEHAAKGWRVRLARWRLRRQTETGNEHLNLAGDPAALAAVRAQLALLYTAEDATSRSAVADLNPLRPAPRRALAATPFTLPTIPTPTATAVGTPTAAADQTTTAPPAPAASDSQSDTQPTNHQATTGTTNPTTTQPTAPTTPATTNQPAATTPKRTTSRPTSRPASGDTPTAPGFHKLVKAYRRRPTATHEVLAETAGISLTSANRYMPKVREFVAAEKTLTPISEPKQPVTAGVNGHHYQPEETNR